MEKIIDHILVKSKETKGTVVYSFEAEVGSITFYIPKVYLKGGRPERIRLVVEELP